MSTRLSIIFGFGLAIFACNKPRDANAPDALLGMYVREYSFKVTNQETGTEIGMRTIRDTILIQPAEGEYEVSNKKWRLNDYDKDGWQSLEHGDDPPMKAFISPLNISSWTLTSKGGLVLHYNREKSQLYWNQAKPYHKVK